MTRNTDSRPTLFEAVRDLLGPIMAEGCRVIDEGSDDMPVTITFGPCEAELTLADLKKLDRAYQQALHEKEQRAERKAKGGLL
jgi:hypothetical protein